MAIAYKVTESNGNVERLGQLAKMAAGMAKSIDGQENPPKLITRSKGINSRRNLMGNRTDRINF